MKGKLPSASPLREASESLVHCFRPVLDHSGGLVFPWFAGFRVTRQHLSLELHVVNQGLQKKKHRRLPGIYKISVSLHLKKIRHHPGLHVVHNIDGSSGMRLEVFEVAKHDVMTCNGHRSLCGAKTQKSAFPRCLPDSIQTSVRTFTNICQVSITPYVLPSLPMGPHPAKSA